MLSLDRQNALRDQYRARQPGWRPATELFAMEVRARLDTDTRVLDLGCGRGGLVEQLEHPLDHIVGIDPDEHSLREHRLHLPRVAGGDRLSFRAGAFDIVYASWVLEHWRDPVGDLGEIRRVLRPGGHFVFITPNALHPLVGFNRLVSAYGVMQRALVTRLYGRAAADTFPVYYRANTPARLERLAQLSGFAQAHVNTVGDPTYLAFTPLLFTLLAALESRTPAARRLHLVGVFQA